MKSTSLTTRDPFRDIDDHFERLLARWPRPWAREREVEWRPATDISETAGEYLIKAELPDVKKEDVAIELQNNLLTIKGERKQEKEEKGKTMHRIERFHGSFMRSFTLPDNVDPKNIKAEMADGVLQVHVPKVEVAQPKVQSIAIG